MSSRTLRHTARQFAERALIVVAIGIVALILAAAGPMLLARKSYIVMGGSMEPTILIGSVVVTELARPNQLQAGHIIAYVPRSEVVTTHRIVQVISDQFGLAFRTRGDANQADDPELVRPANVLGKVSYWIPFAGYLLHFGNQQLTRLVVLAAGLLVLGASLVQAARRRRRAAASAREQPTAAPAALSSETDPASTDAGLAERH